MKLRIERTYQVRQYEPFRVEIKTEVNKEDLQRLILEYGKAINDAILELQHPKTRSFESEGDLDDQPF